MNQQIERIKAKDYSQLDKRLYATLNGQSNIDTTISTLAELQSFLKVQITKIQNEDDKETLLKASQVLFKHVQSEQVAVCQCYKTILPLQSQIKKLKRSLKYTKQYIHKQLRNCVSDIYVDIQEAVYHLQKQNQKLQAQVLSNRRQSSEYKQTIISLKQDNKKLQKNCQEWEMAKKRRRNKSSSYDTHFFTENYEPTHSSILTPSKSIIITNQTPTIPKPLRQKVTEKCRQYNYTKEFRQMNQKQNSILKIKGAEVSKERRSAKKLKLFSLL